MNPCCTTSFTEDWIVNGDEIDQKPKAKDHSKQNRPKAKDPEKAEATEKAERNVTKKRRATKEIKEKDADTKEGRNHIVWERSLGERSL